MPSSRQDSVVSPALDFLLLGGASLVLFPLIMYAFPVKVLDAYHLVPVIAVVFFYLEYLSNFPHFAYSYQLMYRNFIDKIAGTVDPTLRPRYIFAGIVVPAAMIAFFAVSYWQHSTVFLKHAVNAMLLTAGWHYAKQGFGILIVTSVYRKVFYSRWERLILLANAHLLWIYAWIMFNTGSREKIYWGVSFTTLGFPDGVELVFRYAVSLMAGILVFMLFQKYRRESVLPPFNGVTAYVASVYLWIILRFGLGYDSPIHPIVIMIPFMHAIQYMTIVLKMKQNEVARKYISRKAFIFFAVSGVAIGALIFDAVPRILDKTINYNSAVYGTTLFMFMFWIFINIHHYFIDNVIWRREGSEPKTYLFSAR